MLTEWTLQGSVPGPNVNGNWQLHWQHTPPPTTTGQGHRVQNGTPIDMDIHTETRKTPQEWRFPSHVAEFMEDSPFLLGWSLKFHVKQIQLVFISYSPEKHSSSSLTQTITLEFPWVWLKNWSYKVLQVKEKSGPHTLTLLLLNISYEKHCLFWSVVYFASRGSPECRSQRYSYISY